MVFFCILISTKYSNLVAQTIRKSVTYTAQLPIRGRRALQIPLFSFAARVAFSSSSSITSTMTDNARKNFDDELVERLRDPAKRLELWQQMNPGYGHNLTTPSGRTQCCTL